MGQLALALLLLAGPTAFAQSPSEEQAKQLYAEGQTSYDSAQYGDALKDWQAAYKLSDKPVLLYNIALAQEKLGQYSQAIDTLTRYKRSLTPVKQTEVNEKIAALQAMQGPDEQPRAKRAVAVAQGTDEQLRAKQRADDMARKAKLLAALIGTRGDTKGNVMVEDLFADSDASIGSIQDALQNVDGIEVATPDNLGVKKSGGSESPSEPVNRVVGKASLGAIDAGSSEHAGSIKSVVAKKKGQVQYCYEQRLKENPNIGGRLAISVDIDHGRVTQVRIDENATGDKTIESCIKGKVKRWRFSTKVTESIFLPFALSTN